MISSFEFLQIFLNSAKPLIATTQIINNKLMKVLLF